MRRKPKNLFMWSGISFLLAIGSFFGYAAAYSQRVSGSTYALAEAFGDTSKEDTIIFLYNAFYVLCIFFVISSIVLLIMAFSRRSRKNHTFASSAPTILPLNNNTNPFVYCTQCGVRNDKGSLFCQSCGTSLYN